ncbi:MAG: TIGR03435 family protein, partial [Acidobacteriaceae bacterium]|nr:TIGR03435 family protein [Acidobacteriaceae bacterium]
MMLEKFIPAALANHLWQSTVFAIAAMLLAVALRKNRAQTRYVLWLIASLKFLVPFSAFIAIGSQIKLPNAAPIAHPAIPAAVEQISQPFASPDFASYSSGAAVATTWHPIQTILFIIWLCGFVTVLIRWLGCWMRTRAAVHCATPVPIEAPIRVLSSPSSIEPGIFGIFQPVLLLPAGINRHLTPTHLQTILAHELCHVRRRDNFIAALHTFVEAVFWFHPLVWWIGSRLLEERERACDEEVLSLGNQPCVYAESILKVCRFYLASPAACVAGVTGSDLKKRIVRIMKQEITLHLNTRKKLLLAAAGITALALPLCIGAVHAPQNAPQSEPVKGPEFEVTSIKPAKVDMAGRFFVQMGQGGRFHGTISVKMLIEMAYDIKDSQLSGAPSWLDSERYEIDAKPDEATGAAIDKLPQDQRMPQIRSMLQGLLSDRFKLVLGHENKDLPVYALVVAKNGPKFKESTFKPPAQLPDSPPGPPGPGPRPMQPANSGNLDRPGPPGSGPRPMVGEGIRLNGRGELTVTYVDLPMFANVLSRMVGRIVVDKTGLTGKYDFTLKWTPDEAQGSMMPGGRGPAGAAPDGGAPTPADPSGPSIFTALQEQLGLKLES